MENENLRQRAKRKHIRVTFPNDKVICYTNVTDTFIAVLCEIGSDRFPEIKLELCHLPLLSKEIYPRYKEWMKPVCDGWYINIQSSTDQKYIQLVSINDSLNLGLKVEIGEDFEKQVNTSKPKERKAKDKFSVKLPDGSVISTQNGIDTYLQSLEKLGVDTIMRKGIEWNGNPVITNHKISTRQVQIAPYRWASVPSTTKEKAKLIKVIALQLHINVETTIL